jgi:hypothetical protein
MNATVLQDHFASAAKLCAGSFVSSCKLAGIKP